MKGPLIFNDTAVTMLSLMEGSTGFEYWAAEMQRRAGISKPTAKKWFDRFYEVGLVREVGEKSFTLKHPERNLYVLTPLGVDVLRLFKEST
jgi:hypothetical protein